MTLELLKQLDDAFRRFLLVLAGLIVASGVPSALWALIDPQGIYILIFLISMTFATLFGLPVYLARSADGEDSLQSAVVTGAVIGAILPTLGAVLGIFGGIAVFFFMLFFAAFYGAIGATGGAIFWLIVVYPVRRAPDGSPGIPTIGLTLMACLTASTIVVAGLQDF